MCNIILHQTLLEPSTAHLYHFTSAPHLQNLNQTDLYEQLSLNVATKAGTTDLRLLLLREFEEIDRIEMLLIVVHCNTRLG